MPRQAPNKGVLDLAAMVLRQRRSTAGSVQNFAVQTTDDEQRQVNAGLADDLADRFASTTNLPLLHVFAGFLGGAVRQTTDPTNKQWQLLYLDPKLFSWLLVDVDALLLANNVPDPRSAFGSYDYVWLGADASVSQGDGSVQANEIEARFLRGDFVSAADFAASVTSGTYAPPTGQLCPLTPGCCGIKTK